MKDRKAPTRKHALRIAEWCKEKYGRSKYNRGLPRIKVSKTENHEDLAGYYDDEDNCIVVYLLLNDTFEELCGTVIEEWIHYKQSSFQYQKLARIHEYDDHPFEIEAKLIVEKDWETCLKDMKNRYSYFNY